jgi:hypothetical protein
VQVKSDGTQYYRPLADLEFYNMNDKSIKLKIVDKKRLQET